MKFLFLLFCLLGSVSTFADSKECSTEDALKVFKHYYGATESGSDFNARLIPDVVKQTWTLYMTYTYQPFGKGLAWVVLDKDCGELDHGATYLEPVKVFEGK